MKRIPTPLLWLAIALIGMALAAGSFIVVAWLKLQPCPLCIAQRTLFMLMGGVALVAFFTHRNLAGRESAGVKSCINTWPRGFPGCVMAGQTQTQTRRVNSKT